MKRSIESFLLSQSYVLFLFFVMILSGIIQKNKLFDSIFMLIYKYTSSKRGLISIISLFTGALPIPGRVTVTAGVLDIIAPKNKNRAKFGIIDYLSTHHYYLWSPIEKSILIPITILGLTYINVVTMLFPLLIVSLILVLSYIFIYLKEDDIEINVSQYSANYNNWHLAPLLFAIILLIVGYNPAIVFGIVCFWYIYKFNSTFAEIKSYIKPKLLYFVFLIIVLSTFLKSYTSEINNLISVLPFAMDTLSGVFIISIIAFSASFILGSSSRFSGITTMLTLLFGLEYFIWFYAVDFAGYLLSPFHKCTIIGKMYFSTSFKSYYSIIGIWVICLVLVSGCIVFINKDFIKVHINSTAHTIVKQKGS